ncbi:MAG TPA: hypothetical protein VFD83_02130, partial [Candidatus Polarisedimenticolia bacterium]|nr:hypothetical protein [Candidatus Polarisedimenticolia bacterium]
PDLERYFGTWLWLKSDGMNATSTPETKGAARTLVLNSDFTYELHQRRDASDSVLCRGIYNFSEESSHGITTDFLDFQGWFESYEHRMTADFVGPDTLLLSGDRCENCPEHTYLRGRSALFEGTLSQGQPYRHDLWDGLRFELVPSDYGWRIAIRDTSRKDDDLASLTPPYHFVPNPRDVEGWHFRDKVNAPQRVREFIFSPEVGRTIAASGSTAEITEDEVERVRARGRGVLVIEDLSLTEPAKNEKAGIRSMRFRVAIEETRGRSAPSRSPAQRGGSP